MSETYYDVLGLFLDANDGQIYEAYRKKRSEFQADPARLRLIEEAYGTLGNPIKRKNYLKFLALEESQVDTDDTLLGQSTDAELSSAFPSPTRSPKRRATQVFGPEDDQPAQPAHSISPLSSQPGRRRSTEVFEPEQGVTPRRSAQPSAPTPSTGRRRPTEFLEPDREKAPPYRPASPAPSGPRRSGRRSTEVGEPGQEPKPQTSRPARRRTEIEPIEKPGKPGPSKRPETKPVDESFEPTRADDAPAKIVAEVEATPPSKIPNPPYVQVSYQQRSYTYELKPGENVIGRPPKHGEQPTVPLPDPERFISRCHAIITILGSACQIVDPGSKNGTYLNGHRLVSRQTRPIQNGDVIVIEGREIRVRLV